MAQQVDLLQEVNQKYVIDACAMLDFWGSIAGFRRPYDIDIAAFRKIWEHIAQLVLDGVILIPEVIYQEVDKTTIKEFHEWLLKHKSLYVEYDDAIDELAAIVQKIEIYTTDKVSINDAIVVAIAKKKGLTVITSERKSSQLNLNKPKVPNVCDEFDVAWLNLPDFFKAEGL